MKKLRSMADSVEEYLAVRRAFGFDLSIAGKLLRGFAQLADQTAPGTPLTLDLALRWAQSSQGSRPTGPARRLEVLRPFARYLHGFDRHNEIPPNRILGPAHRRPQPYIFTHEEIRSLLDAAARLDPQGGLRSKTVQTYLALLSCTGMRPTEPLRLTGEDVDLAAGTITIRKTKFSKSRIVPLHHSVTQALRAYLQTRDQQLPEAKCSAFFLLDDGGPLTRGKAVTAFHRAWSKPESTSQAGRKRPRLYDLRHTFVCWRLLAWYREGVDVHKAMPALSTYLGHVKVTDTYWYLTAIPELMELVSSRFERYAGSVKGGNR